MTDLIAGSFESRSTTRAIRQRRLTNAVTRARPAIPIAKASAMRRHRAATYVITATGITGCCEVLYFAERFAPARVLRGGAKWGAHGACRFAPPRAQRKCFVASAEGRAVADPPVSSPGRVFISYRREETAYAAGWLFDRLADHLGRDQIFKDVDSIQLGDDFVEVITTAVSACDVLLALIGDRWLTISDERGRVRLEDPNDFVRLEIEAAVRRDIRVIPVLVDGARMPRSDELPPSLAKLGRRQALELSAIDFDTSRLLKVLDSTLAHIHSTAVEPATRTDEVTAQTPEIAAPATDAERQDKAQAPTRKRRRRILTVATVAAAAGAAGLTLALVFGSDGGNGSTVRTVEIPANQAWTDTHVVCRAGAVFEITANGTILHNNTTSQSAVGPDGDSNPDLRQFNAPGLPNVNHAALIGSIDRKQPSFVGKQATYRCSTTGSLFLGINDAGLNNNSGHFTAVIKPGG